MNPRIVLALAAAVVTITLASAVPVLDEESYLDIARQLDPSRPYDWWRPWPPWGLDRGADVFVYAHPPGFLIWVWAWVRLAGGIVQVAPLKIAAGLPWAMLFAWSLGRLAERTSRRPWLVSAIWVSSPIVLLSLQRGLMPDLILSALITTAVVSWLEGQTAVRQGERIRWWMGGGLALAGAVSVKYSALSIVPALALHQLALRPRPRALSFWVTAVGAILAVELWLAVEYGRVHLLYVLSRATDIGHSALGARGLGVAVRLGFGLLLLPLVGHRWRRFLPIMLTGGILLAMVGAPSGTTFTDRVQMAAWAALGLGWVLLAVRELFSPKAPSADRTPADGILLGAWALAGITGVLFGHNFAAPRYLLPTIAPLAILLVRAVTHRANLRIGLWMAAGGSALLSLMMVWSEHRFFDAGDAAARSMALAAPEGGCFTGEWSFRHHLQHAGWTFCGTLDDMRTLPSGSLIAAPMHSSPGELPEGLERVHEASFGWAPVRMLDAENGVGWYGESLGALPLAWNPGPLEAAAVWRVP